MEDPIEGHLPLKDSQYFRHTAFCIVLVVALGLHTESFTFLYPSLFPVHFHGGDSTPDADVSIATELSIVVIIRL